MREPDVRLTDHERAMFAELERRLAPAVRWRRSITMLAIAAMVIGLTALVGGLLGGAPAIGAAGFATAVAGIAVATRRLTPAACWHWWRSERGPPRNP